MLNTSLFKFLTQPVVGTALLIAAFSAYLPSVMAQSSTDQRCLSQALRNTTQQNESDTSTYTLGGGDRIRVNVFEVPEYTGEYQVPPGGAINLPLIGSVRVQGLTTEQAADLIACKYSTYLKRPLISVNLLSPRPINIFVAGEVTRPGAYTLSLSGGAGDNPGVQYPTVLAALTTAQGVTLAADVTQVQLRRKVRSSERVVTLNLKQLIQTGTLPEDITLRDGDTIVVPTATDFNVAESRNIFAANFAASQTTPRTVTIIGEVNRPGSYLVTPGSINDQGGGTANSGTATPTGLPNVTRVIQLAGGITAQADIRNLRLRRLTRSGSEQAIDINLWQLLQSGDANQDIIVQDGDTIVIPTATEINPAEATQLATTTLSPARIQVGVVGEVKRPGLTDVQPNSSLNQAILAAGGFNDARASSSAVDLIRLNPNGSVTKRVVKIDFSAGINEQTNPILRNNDVVVVGRSGIAKFGDTTSTVTGPLGVIFSILNLFGL
ncbi:SLBB domain-containing protein [Nostoc sp. FACHB-973]|uniref:SLBB domain-containing protein n=1 Tax=Desmonostoc muscorum LEGE 12446 TaxID=1828758 RepID=A0A8J7DDW6_DESMC|nr:SLBB domain-containing protein [Desmonostoc muscorum]MBD2518427.1 SLBB domain-containing protein [Nostoc sp. FACHB-973]MBX9255128.1 SLBB domain-containing protein [Desmonostoc muscorum CCALA 125]MCF2147820.1 SLBB domain-containing protein [Desmonostoc muscorum LEGE 12446]